MLTIILKLGYSMLNSHTLIYKLIDTLRREQMNSEAKIIKNQNWD